MTYDPLPIEQDPAKIAALLIAEVAGRTGATINEGHPMAALLEAVAMGIADLNYRLARRADSFFDEFGQQVVGIARKQARYATLVTRATAITPSDVAEVPIGTVFTADGYRYELVEGGQIGTEWTLLALLEGAGPNGTTPTSLRAVERPLTVSCTTTTPVEGGATGETMDAYRDRLAEALSRMVTTAITPDDFTRIALGVPGVTRAKALNRHDPATPGEDAPGHITLVLAGENGQPLGHQAETEVRTRVEAVRAINLTVHLAAPTVVSVAVKVWVGLTPEGQAETARQAVQNAVKQVLAPGIWDSPETAKLWAHEISRQLDLIPGVAAIHNVTINGQTSVTIGQPGAGAIMLTPTVEVVTE